MLTLIEKLVNLTIIIDLIYDLKRIALLLLTSCSWWNRIHIVITIL